MFIENTPSVRTQDNCLTFCGKNISYSNKDDYISKISNAVLYH